MSELHLARHFSLTGDGRIRCEVCPRACTLRDGQRGLCFVRERVGDKLILSTYGRSSGFCVDPIEKKPLNHFYPGSPVLSFGTAGCNLSCRFCQNWDITRSRETDTLCDSAPPESIADTASRLKCQSVAFTYNDPVVFLEYAVDTALACHEKHIKTVAVTAGYMSDKAREEFYSPMDAANVDLKGFSEAFYFKQCGGHLQPVLETLQYLRQKTQVWLEITTLLIPTLNDSDAELEAMTQWIAEHLGPNVPLHFSAFHPAHRMLDVEATPASTLQRARRIAIKNGLRYAYTGNIHDLEGGTTFCHQCNKALIRRDWYLIKEHALTTAGACSSCGTKVAGHFASQPGTWGARRQPVRITRS